MTMRRLLPSGTPPAPVPVAPAGRAARARRGRGRLRPAAAAAALRRQQPPPPATVVVFGAAGRTGHQVVLCALRRGLCVRACTRDGALPAAFAGLPPALRARLCSFRADVTDRRQVAGALEGARACVFAATAGAAASARAVDAVAPAAAAGAARRAGLARFVLVSGAGVRHPRSQAYRLLNLFGRRMDHKVAGEEGVRAAYEGAPSGVRYTVVRPSGLTDAPPKGAAQMTVRQGDGAAGRVSRGDVAEVIAELCACADGNGDDKELADNATFELYDTGSGVPAHTLTVGDILSDEALAGSALLRMLGAAPQSPRAFAEAGGERASRAGCATYSELLSGLATDAELAAQEGGDETAHTQ